jgi:hypothetical protein
VRRARLLCGAVLLVLAVACLVEAVRLKDDWQGARLMPGVLAVVFAVLAVTHLRPAPADAAPAEWPDTGGRRRIALVFGALVVYAALLEPIGFLFATALFVLCVLRVLGTWSWMTTTAITLSMAIVCDAVFRRWLGMPLP